MSDHSADQWWARSSQEALKQFDVSQENGLKAEQVKKRKIKYGLNQLRETKKKSVWVIWANQFKSLIIGLLLAAAVLSFAFHEIVEGIAISAVIIINALMGFFTEWKAVRSMEALQKLGGVTARVRRHGEIQEIQAEEIVPGDIVIVEGGDVVTADVRLFEASKLQADESPLTGESVPVSKTVEPVSKEATLAERPNMLFKGTAVTRGSGEGLVVSTGMETELGQISALVEEAGEETTLLEKQLNKLGHKLIWITLAIALLVAASGIMAGKATFLMVETAIALAIAAIPEGLPIVATIALARGMWRMAKRNALINRLSAVETLGSTNIIFTDKTGTMTENRMTLTQMELESGTVNINERFSKQGENIDPSEDSLLKLALETGLLCNNAYLPENRTFDEGQAVGEPLEIALLVAAAKAGLSRDDIVENLPEEREEAFDSDVMMMATFHKQEQKYRVAVKGAPEKVLDACSSIHTQDGPVEMKNEAFEQWVKKNKKMAEEGLRVLALATKTVDSVKTPPYQDLVFVGLVGMLDPPRPQVSEAILSCKKAGIRTIMVTGDQEITARKIGLEVGLVSEDNAEVIHGREIQRMGEFKSEEQIQPLLQASIFARISPKQKLDLIDLYQKQGNIVAMTGDGVNDAPALKKADIGVAMGKRGTQVAREASDMVLKDDAFSTIVSAVEQGRVIFNNIRRFVIYLLSCNISEILTVFLASMVNAPLPILPLQILFLNFVTDVFPALALGAGEGDPDIMTHPPRDSKEPIITRSRWIMIGGYGFMITASVLGALALAMVCLGMAQERAVTISFLTLAFAQLWHVFNMRDRGSNFFVNDITRNLYVWGALFLCVALLIMVVYIPVLAAVLKLVDPGFKGWALVFGMSLLPFFIGQISIAAPSIEKQKSG
ncbi:MAG: HAD-IC family P-type ATPase [Candidatus Aminicenantes bacterium]|nr:HAD-IC family P-type ATPase [Candidatus Aminicenantes bacterium]